MTTIEDGSAAGAAGGRTASAGDLSAPVIAVVVLAPVLLAVGWTVAAMVQVEKYDWTAQTISVLAGQGATDPWIMVVPLLTAAVIFVGLAMRLNGLVTSSRALLLFAGVGVGVAALAPQPVGGSSPVHMSAAACAWIALTVWPSTVRARDGVQLGLPRCGYAATAVLAVLMGWFFLELLIDGLLLGAVERLLILAQLVYPTWVAVSLRRRRSSAVDGTL